ncbi:meiotic recombination protein REC114 [Gastrophryne carolinensis]
MILAKVVNSVFELNEESANITLSILSTGHFLISQGHTLLEGFSLISARTWLKIGKKMDCLLFGSKAQDDSRMFRVQFLGDSKEMALKNCESCFLILKYYLSDQNKAMEESVKNSPQKRISLKQIGESLLTGQVHFLETAEQNLSFIEAGLDQFIKLCLLDQHFPAFVEAVEKELHKLTGN